MRHLVNPSNFLARFLMHFALAFSACLVVMAVLLVLKRLDFPLAAIWAFGFSVPFGLLRAYLAKPGTNFWSSPVVEKQ